MRAPPAKTVMIRIPLYVVTVLVLSLLLAWVGVFPWWPTITHAVALPPLDLYHDLRVLFSASNSYVVFIIGALASIVLRAALLAWLVAGVVKGQFMKCFRFVLLWYVVALPFMLLAAGSSFSAGAVLYYGFFWIGALIAMSIFVLLAPIPWMGSFTFWRGGMRIVTAAAYVSLLLAVSILADVNVLAGLLASAVLTVCGAYVMAKQRFIVPRIVLAGVTAGVIGWLLFVVITGPPKPDYNVSLKESQPNEGSILIMSGVDSASGDGAIFEVDPRALGFTCKQTYYYSYAGPGYGAPQNSAACPIRSGAPYKEIDTYRPLRALVEDFAAQISTLPTPITVATHSQGVWVIHEAVTTGMAPGVANVIYIGPFPDNWVAYPTRGERQPGRVGTDFVDTTTRIERPGGTAAFSPHLPLSEELLSSPDNTNEIMRRPLPNGVEGLSIMSAFDLPLTRTRELPYTANACPVPVVHPDLPYAPGLHQSVRRFLKGQPVGTPCPAWRIIIGPAFRNFGPSPTPGFGR